MNTLQLQFLLLIFAGWVNRSQLDVIAFCFERRVPRTVADRDRGGGGILRPGTGFDN
jgi:hypothetical protein